MTKAQGQRRAGRGMGLQRGLRSSPARPRSKPRSREPEGQSRPQAEIRRPCRTSSSRSSAARVDRPPAGPAGCMRSSSTATACRLRVEDGTRRPAHPQGPGLDGRASPASPRPAPGLPDGIIDGEIVALDEDGAPDFAALQAAAVRGQDRPSSSSSPSTCCTPAARTCAPCRCPTRKERLQAFLASRASPTRSLRFVEHFDTGGDAVLQSACRLSLEGIVSKRADAPYRSGRSETLDQGQVPRRPRDGHRRLDRHRRAASARCIVGVHRDGHLVHVGRIGTGFGRDKVDRLHAAAEGGWPQTRARSPAPAPHDRRATSTGCARNSSPRWSSPAGPRLAWCGRPRSRACARTSPPPRSKPRRPRQRRPRPSPSPGTRRPALGGKRPTSRLVMGVTISRPDKVMWPEAAGGDGLPVTKLDLARYFEAVGTLDAAPPQGPPLLHHPGAGRLRRARPSSSAMPCRARRSLLELVTVSGDRKPYLEIDRVEGLAAVAQTAALELHPWNCEPFHPDVPGRLVFDLDPGPEVAFATVIEAAREMRDRLAELGLVSFCKTTGGKGLHVVTPLSPRRRPATRLGGGEGVRPRGLPGDGERRAGPLRRQHGQEAPHRPHLPRLPAQRPARHRGRAAVAPRPPRRAPCRCRSPGRR